MITQEHIQAIAHQIARKFNPLKVVLFGSYGRDQAHPRSDVDLLVILFNYDQHKINIK